MAGHTAERVTLARLPSGVAVATTVHTYRGDREGPTLYVQAAQHGREVNGAEVLRRFHDAVDPGSLAGRVIAVPVADPLTFDRVSYTTPEQLDAARSNMNRVWPGDADAAVDLHTGAPDMLPHVVFREGDDRSRALAEAFGTDLLLSEPAGEDAPEEWAERSFDGKFRVAAGEAGVPAITPELAHNKQLVEPAIELGLDGLLNVLRELEMLPGDPDPRGERTLARNHLGRVPAADSGLFRPAPDVAVGDRVQAGDSLGTLYDPTTYEPLQSAAADRDGILYSITREATVTAGQSLANVADLRD